MIVPIVVAVLFFAVLRNFFHITRTGSVTTYVVQGIFGGAALTVITVFVILPTFYVTKVNGWTTMFGCGEPGSGLLLRAACNVVFRGPINVPQEAMYWTTSKDGSGHKLSGAHDYTLRFAAGQLPPNNAFWSLTMSDAGNRFVPNPVNRFSLGDRSGLVPNANGSVDIYIQHTAPTGHESNWLPAPAGDFILWLRVYLPDQTVLDGEYKMPPVIQTL
jgi:hypothetical protein